MAAIKLKKCPFCGGKAKILDCGGKYTMEYYEKNWKVGCQKCNVLVSGTDRFDRKDNGEFNIIQDGWKEATDLWNRRK